MWGAHKEEVGDATHFLSYPAILPLEEIVEAASDALGNNNEEHIFIFMDILREGIYHVPWNAETVNCWIGSTPGGSPAGWGPGRRGAEEKSGGSP